MRYLYIVFLFFSVMVSAQKPEEKLYEVRQYLDTVVRTFQTVGLVYVVDSEGNNEQIVVGGHYYVLDSLLQHKEQYRKMLATAWDGLKSNDKVTLEKILSAKDSQSVKKQLLTWKYNEADLSLTNILEHFDFIMGIAAMPGKRYYDDYEEVPYLPENYDDDRMRISRLVSEFNYLADTALALHKQRVLEKRY